MDKINNETNSSLAVVDKTGSEHYVQSVGDKSSGFSLKLGTKIGLGFALVGLVLAAAVGITIYQVKKTDTIVHRLTELRTPTAQASLGMLNGLNHSLAALRGWMILGKDKFKEERGKAWSEEITDSYDQLKAFSTNWTNPKNIDRLKIIGEKLKDFEKYQTEIEAISQTVENTPATKILFNEAAPQAAVLASNITKLINAELELEATPERKALLGMMADVRGTLGLGLANIRAYLLSGDIEFKEKFGKLWEKNSRRFADISENTQLLTPAQLEFFNLFSSARTTFNPLPAKMFKIRGSEEWNLANKWLGTKAAPTAFAIKTELDAMVASQKKLMQTDIQMAEHNTLFLQMLEWILLGTGLLIATIIGFYITLSITRPITSMVTVVKDIAAGDFTKKIIVKGKDEIAVLSETVNTMVGNLAIMIKEVKSNAGTVAAASDQLSSVSSEMASASQDTASLSNNVAGATEQMSTNINTMASAAEEMSVSVTTLSSNAEEIAQTMTTVASAIEEMSASINDVEKNAKDALQVAGNASEMSKNATGTMNTLGTAANEIGKVTEVIKRIAEQTNLLALNATIEAASAGEAGKGFAVVANEIKELANQSAVAAEDIASKIEGVQGNTDEAVKVIDDVAKVIDTINESVNVISDAVEQQTQAANDISSNVAEASRGVQTTASAIAEIDKGANDVSRNTGEAASATNEVSENIQSVNSAATKNSTDAKQINTSATELSLISESLQKLVSAFKIKD